ncbi:PadR family transcriptional regulator [Nocardia sp. BMG111209]|uniref:PadR family transcriptional regulator n=1 Tax=Nocardia sp. BMG111209 TaxID=1160137 RepID=UPI0003807637|nr:PadR family transcriptional regulator [Nocardia sp. BMG111209]
MSLRHALLGLLAEQPASGWDLTRRFDELLGSVWPAGHPQIYGELRKLQQDGYIVVDGEGPRGRKDYRITDTGLAEVRRWLTEVEVDHTFRLEPLLRSVFFWLMTPGELADHLEREAAFYHGLAEAYRKLSAAKDNGEYGYTPQVAALRVTAEAGVRITEALGDWADWAAGRPPGGGAAP